VQQRLSRSRNKRLTTLHANLELEGLVIDWHLADTDMVASDSVPLWTINRFTLTLKPAARLTAVYKIS